MKKVLLIVAWTVALVGCTPNTESCNSINAELNLPVQILALDGGTTTLEKSFFDESYAGQGEITIPVCAFLIEHPKGTLLWDTGHSDNYLADKSHDMGDHKIRVTKGIANQIRELGLEINDIDYLAFSHWHFDHTGNANYFRDATIVGQKDEYELAFSERAKASFGMKPETYFGLKENNTKLFEGDFDVFGDGRVKILRASGHTVGSQVLYGGPGE